MESGFGFKVKAIHKIAERAEVRQAKIALEKTQSLNSQPPTRLPKEALATNISKATQFRVGQGLQLL